MTPTHIKLGATRGHQNCLKDANVIVGSYPDSDQKEHWNSEMQQFDKAFRTICGGVGMPHYVPRKLRRPYDLSDLYALDELIKEELGSAYDNCLKMELSGGATGADEASNAKNR